MIGGDRVLYAGPCQSVPLRERLVATKVAGFTAISVWPGDVKGQDRAEVRAAIAAAGLALTDLEVIGNWLPEHQTARGGFADLMRLATPEKLLPLAAKLGARTVSAAELIDVDCDGPALARHFGQMCDRAAEYGLSVAIEFVPTGAIPDLNAAIELVDRAGRANGGIMVDSWHFFRSHSSCDDLARTPGDRIFSIQLSDARAKPEADLEAGMMNRLLPGDGELDMRTFMQALTASGTSAPIGIETFSANLQGKPMASIAAECAVALDHCLAFSENPY